MIAPRFRHVMRLFQGPPPSPAQRLTVVPRESTRSLEARAGVEVPAATPADIVHSGSSNLELWPPSTVEMELARVVIRVPEADEVAPFATALSDLIIVTQSPERASAVLHLARVEREAERVIAKVTGGGR